MKEEISKNFYSKLSNDIFSINGNRGGLIPMKKFLSFLTVPTVKSNTHLWCATGWTLRENFKLTLEIRGGLLQDGEYLNSLKLGKNLMNPYNNFVNPFYLGELMTDEGHKFFIKYYQGEIDKLIKKAKEKADIDLARWKTTENIYRVILKESKRLNSYRHEV